MKSIRRIVIPAFALVALLVLSGCATPYQNTGFAGGFSESRTGRSKFSVAFAGNGYTSGKRAGELCLLRCAELTLGNEFRYFVLSENRNEIDRSTSITSGTYGGGIMFATTQSIPKPSARNTIICFRDKPNGFDDVFDAREVWSNLASKYGIGAKPKTLNSSNGKAILGISFEMSDGLTVKYRVRGFVEGSEAEKAGLRVGDTVLACNGISMKDTEAARADKQKWQVGDTVEVTVERGMKKVKIPVKTIFNDQGIAFRPIREDFGNLPKVDLKEVVFLESADVPFNFIPLAQFSDYENPTGSMEEFKLIAAQQASKCGGNVVHVLRTQTEVNQFFESRDNSQVGFASGILFAPPADLGVTFERGAGYEKRRVIRRVMSSDAQAAGLLIGDNVLALNGIDVLSDMACDKERMRWKVGDTVEVTVARAGKEIKIPVKVAANEIRLGRN